MAVEFPRFLQTKQYSAKLLRDVFLDAPVQNGVLGAGDLMVTQRGAGANMSVDVAAGSGWVKGTSSARQGLYNLYNDATVNVTLTAANATNPRVDQIILRVYDSTDGGSAQDIGALEVVTGTATAGATLNNRTGVGALPAHSIVIADVLVPAAAASVTNANIRDRRAWARGAYGRLMRTQNAAAGSNYTTTSSVYAAIDATNLSPRIECSGAPLKLCLRGQISHTTTNSWVAFNVTIDGTMVDGLAANAPLWFSALPAAGFAQNFNMEWEIIPTAGSHIIAPQFATAGATGTLIVNATTPVLFTWEELPTRQNTANNTVTTG